MMKFAYIRGTSKCSSINPSTSGRNIEGLKFLINTIIPESSIAYPKRSEIEDVGVYDTEYIESFPFEVVQLPHLVCTATCG